MIGIFDSGSGGLTFLAAMKKRFPDWSYLYYADYEHCPFGEKTPEEIQSFTIAGVQKLFDAGAVVVILACNTASAWTLRKIQTEVFPDKKVLWVTIPGAEKVVDFGLKNVAVFATEQTVKSRTYAERVRILDPDTVVDEIAFSWNLVRSIEELLPISHCYTEEDFQKILDLYGPDGWNCDTPEWRSLVNTYFWCIRDCQNDTACTSLPEACLWPKTPLFFSTKNSLWKRLPDGIILGCTHYSYLRKPLQRLFSGSVIIDPSEESAVKLGDYLAEHPDLLRKIDKTGTIKFL
jgi:glutamate racemase